MTELLGFEVLLFLLDRSFVVWDSLYIDSQLLLDLVCYLLLGGVLSLRKGRLGSASLGSALHRALFLLRDDTSLKLKEEGEATVGTLSIGNTTLTFDVHY
jgi:hypothetical protein